MSAAEALEVARAVGIRVEIDGDDLVLEAPTAPPPRVLDLMSRYKADIVTLLRLADEGWSTEDWQVFFDERAGIAEFDGGLSRGPAEARAFGYCVVEWLIRNPPCLPPGQCHANDSLLPLGTENIGSPWPHSGCWPAWDAGRKGEAVAALAAMGIAAPAEFPNDFGKNGEA